MTSQPWFAETLAARSAVGNSRIWRLPRAQLFRCRPHSCQRKVASHSQNTTRSGPHGAVVSTLGDSSAFFGAFFGGRVFSSKWLDHMQKWTPLFFPMSYGMGLMRFRLPPVMTTFRIARNDRARGRFGRLDVCQSRTRHSHCRFDNSTSRSGAPLPFPCRGDQLAAVTLPNRLSQPSGVRPTIFKCSTPPFPPPHLLTASICGLRSAKGADATAPWTDI